MVDLLERINTTLSVTMRVVQHGISADVVCRVNISTLWKHPGWWSLSLTQPGILMHAISECIAPGQPRALDVTLDRMRLRERGPPWLPKDWTRPRGRPGTQGVLSECYQVNPPRSLTQIPQRMINEERGGGGLRNSANGTKIETYSLGPTI